MNAGRVKYDRCKVRKLSCAPINDRITCLVRTSYRMSYGERLFIPGL